MENKTTKIKKIIEDIIKITPDFISDRCDEYYECPFCGGITYKIFATMEDIEHCEDCSYMLAKELVNETI